MEKGNKKKENVPKNENKEEVILGIPFFLKINLFVLIISFLFKFNPSQKEECHKNRINWKIFNLTKDFAQLEEKKYDFEELPPQKIKNSPLNKQNVVIGINFGTINSGYSYSINNDLNNIFINKNEINALETSRINNEGMKYSSTAIISLMNYRNEELNKINFIHGIKSIFSFDEYNNDNICFVYPNEYVTNFNIKDIIKEYFILFKNSILKNVRDKKMINDNLILWVISIPISWKEYEKQIILKAADESGMKNVKLIYEHEAISLSMLSDRYIDKKYKIKNKVFMVIDAGGFYSNITINEIQNEESVKEKINIQKNIVNKNIGILTVLEEILKILEQIFGENYINYLKRKEPGYWVKILEEIVNKAIKNTYCIDGVEIFEINSKFKGKGVYEYLYNSENGVKKYNIEYNEFSVIFPAGLIGNIIFKNVNEIINIAYNIIDEMKYKNIIIDNIIVTGGLSQNKIFKSEIEKKFKNKANIEYLSSYENIISKGAVIYGINQDKIKSRISKETIGISKKESNNKNIEILVKKGQEITNISLYKFIKPSLNGQEIIQINVFSSENQHLSESDFIGRLLIHLGNQNKGIFQLNIDYDIDLKFYAIDYETGKEIKTNFEFFK